MPKTVVYDTHSLDNAILGNVVGSRITRQSAPVYLSHSRVLQSISHTAECSSLSLTQQSAPVYLSHSSVLQSISHTAECSSLSLTQQSAPVYLSHSCSKLSQVSIQHHTIEWVERTGGYSNWSPERASRSPACMFIVALSEWVGEWVSWHWMSLFNKTHTNAQICLICILYYTSKMDLIAFCK